MLATCRPLQQPHALGAFLAVRPHLHCVEDDIVPSVRREGPLVRAVVADEKGILARRHLHEAPTLLVVEARHTADAPRERARKGRAARRATAYPVQHRRGMVEADGRALLQRWSIKAASAAVALATEGIEPLKAPRTQLAILPYVQLAEGHNLARAHHERSALRALVSDEESFLAIRSFQKTPALRRVEAHDGTSMLTCRNSSAVAAAAAAAAHRRKCTEVAHAPGAFLAVLANLDAVAHHHIALLGLESVALLALVPDEKGVISLRCRDEAPPFLVVEAGDDPLHARALLHHRRSHSLVGQPHSSDTLPAAFSDLHGVE
mmetsp:Transcript_58686/g.168532  ORF Transcript_58686/g.168532 Transcript_58686/m.168532 type:complete len:320 (-) Transcript_58686:204-1163(-)